MEEDSNITELESHDSIFSNLIDEQEREWFHDAFFTEGGDEVKHGITFRELADVIICAGKDITYDKLHKIWPYDIDKISYEEALQIYQQLPHTNFGNLSQSFAAMTFDGILDYERIITYLEDSILDKDDEDYAPENCNKQEVLKWFREKQFQNYDIEKKCELDSCRKFKLSKTEFIRKKLLPLIYIMKEMKFCQNRLRSINKKIIIEQNKIMNSANQMYHHSANQLYHQSSSESLSSRFTNTRINIDISNNSKACTQFNGGSGSAISSYREINNEKVTLKSFVIQRSMNKASCLSYSFTTFRPQRIRVSISINEKMDSLLGRFRNHVFGYIIMEETNIIYGITKRKYKDSMCTEWIQVPIGTFTFRIKFCRPLKMIEPERRDEILDSRRLLTKSFRIMLMNLFDMFDLDDDSLLNKDEFELYSIMSGSGKLLNGKWEAISKHFQLRDNGFSMKTFINMHQKEADSYGPNTYLQNMWKAIRQLGHNVKFFTSTACPLLLEFELSEGASFSPFKIYESSAEAEEILINYFWDNSTLLPYLKEQQLLRYFKTEYFAVLMAGKNREEIIYKLDLSASYNVNIEGNGLIIEQRVPINTLKILTIAIAQSDSWYLSVKCNTSRINF